MVFKPSLLRLDGGVAIGSKISNNELELVQQNCWKKSRDIKTEIKDMKEKTIGKITFYQGKLENKDVVLLKTGVEKVNAAVGANTVIREFGAEMVYDKFVQVAANNSAKIVKEMLKNIK